MKTRTLLGIVLVSSVVSTTVIVAMMLGSSGSFDLPFSGETTLSGPVPDTFEVPPLPAAPVVLPGATWVSLPARSPDGTVAGLVADEGQGLFVALDEATGAVRWKLATGPLPASFVRTEGWRPREGAPDVPLALRGAGAHVVAWDRTWLLVADGGASFKTGEFPAAVPPVSAAGGVCLVDGKFWIAVADGRDGGITLDVDGKLADARSDRPPTCPHLGDQDKVQAVSPLQNAHANPDPVAPDDPARGYPVDICGKYSNGRVHGNAYCSDMRSDGGGEQAILLKAGAVVFRDGDDWHTVRFPIGPPVDFYPRITGYELAYPRAFFSMEKYRPVTTQNDPPPGSFEPRRVEQWTEVVELVGSISREGALQWVHTVQRGPSVNISATFMDNIAHFRSLLLASHADSPVKNIYVFKPGMLLALDQATGAPRFQVGTPHPVSTAPLVAPSR